MIKTTKAKQIPVAGKVLIVAVPCALIFVLFASLSLGGGMSWTRMEKAKVAWIYSNGSALAGSFNFVLKPNPEFENLNVTEASEKFSRLVKNFKTKCQKVERYGKAGDGGYLICMDEHIAPKQNSCLVYSFGIRNEWSFDDAVHDELGCEVHSFDPSMGAQDHKRKERLYFHNMGIWDKITTNELGWKLAGLQDIINMLGHKNRNIDYLKIDVEGAEWPLLKKMLQQNSIRNVKQMIFEIHTPKLQGSPMTVADYGDIYRDMWNLDEKLGFKLWTEAHVNGCCFRFAILTEKHLVAPYDVCCFELFYINQKYFSVSAGGNSTKE